MSFKTVVSFNLVWVGLDLPTTGEKLEVFQFLEVVEAGTLFPGRSLGRQQDFWWGW